MESFCGYVCTRVSLLVQHLFHKITIVEYWIQFSPHPLASVVLWPAAEHKFMTHIMRTRSRMGNQLSLDLPPENERKAWKIRNRVVEWEFREHLFFLPERVRSVHFLLHTFGIRARKEPIILRVGSAVYKIICQSQWWSLWEEGTPTPYYLRWHAIRSAGYSSYSWAGFKQQVKCDCYSDSKKRKTSPTFLLVCNCIKANRKDLTLVSGERTEYIEIGSTEWQTRAIECHRWQKVPESLSPKEN